MRRVVRSVWSGDISQQVLVGEYVQGNITAREGGYAVACVIRGNMKYRGKEIYSNIRPGVKHKQNEEGYIMPCSPICGAGL